MGQLILSLLLNEQYDTKNVSNTSEERPEGATPLLEDWAVASTVPKWSASNAFDPDSEEFWSGDDVVYEAFVDTNVEEEERRERLEEEAHLIASGNESRRRRRENPWVSMERISEPQDTIGESVATSGTGIGSTNPRVRIYGETVIMDRVIPTRLNSDSERFRDRDPSLTTRGIRTLHSRANSSQHLSPPDLTSRFPSSNATPPNPSSGNVTPGNPGDMITDVVHRTASPSPMPYFTYGDVHVYVPHTQQRTRHRRRESQPAPTSISLMG